MVGLCVLLFGLCFRDTVLCLRPLQRWTRRSAVMAPSRLVNLIHANRVDDKEKMMLLENQDCLQSPE
jgi:hypothetical protein